MSIWNSRIGKFKKKDPNHGWLWMWLKDNGKAFWEASLRRGYCKNHKGKTKCSCTCKEKNNKDSL